MRYVDFTLNSLSLYLCCERYLYIYVAYNIVTTWLINKQYECVHPLTIVCCVYGLVVKRQFCQRLWNEQNEDLLKAACQQTHSVHTLSPFNLWQKTDPLELYLYIYIYHTRIFNNRNNTGKKSVKGHYTGSPHCLMDESAMCTHMKGMAFANRLERKTKMKKNFSWAGFSSVFDTKPLWVFYTNVFFWCIVE